MHLEPGLRIDGRYVVKSLIGEGGMANVYLAEDIILHRDVAVKILHENLAKQERFVERFRREAEAVATLIHPNIVEIFDVGEYQGMYFIVMELLIGKTLKEIIQEKHFLSVSETIYIMQQVCDGVSVAHEHGIIHRDLKPQNISIAEDNSVKIMDFGIAYQQEATPLTQTNAVMGSVHYLSPEQAKGDNATLRTDVYSLGIVMYEMLVGKVPFTGESAVNIVLQHLREPIPYVSEKNIHIPQSVENIVLKATAKREEDRYEDLMAMKQDLDTCLEMDRMNEPRLYFEMPDRTVEEEELIQQAQSLLAAEDSNTNKKKLTKKQMLFAAGGVGTVVILAIVAFVMMLSGSKVEMPDVRNMTLADATIKLQESNLVIGVQKEEPSDVIEVGKIIKTDKEQKIIIKKGSTVHLTVSLGKEVKMPNLEGKTEAEAIAMLDALGIMHTRAEEMTQDPEKDGKVYKQSVKADEPVLIEETKEQKVSYTVFVNREIHLPSFIGQNISNLESFASANNLKVEVVEQLPTAEGYEEGRIIDMPDYWDGMTVTAGDVIRVRIANGKKIEPEPIKPTKPNEEEEEDQSTENE